jgi:hypothetical protein
VHTTLNSSPSSEYQEEGESGFPCKSNKNYHTEQIILKESFLGKANGALGNLSAIHYQISQNVTWSIGCDTSAKKKLAAKDGAFAK